jgi:hypothetical protein
MQGSSLADHINVFRFSVQNHHILDRTIVASTYLKNWMIQRGHNASMVSVVRNGMLQ